MPKGWMLMPRVRRQLSTRLPAITNPFSIMWAQTFTWSQWKMIIITINLWNCRPMAPGHSRFKRRMTNFQAIIFAWPRRNHGAYYPWVVQSRTPLTKCSTVCTSWPTGYGQGWAWSWRTLWCWAWAALSSPTTTPNSSPWADRNRNFWVV